jgi:hypothetical protein
MDHQAEPESGGRPDPVRDGCSAEDEAAAAGVAEAGVAEDGAAEAARAEAGAAEDGAAAAGVAEAAAAAHVETGEPRVDAALRLLDRLSELPVTEHAAVFEQVQAELTAVLGQLDPESAGAGD